jgi:hypothetical protein
VFLSQVGKGREQADDSNDCGICTCVIAAAYRKGILSSNLLEPQEDGIPNTMFLALRMPVDDFMGRFGRLGRRHILETLQNGYVDTSDKILVKGIYIEIVYGKT